MNHWLMDFMDVLLMDDWLMNFVDDWLMVFVDNIFMDFINNILMMFMNNIHVLFLDDGFNLMGLYNRSILMSNNLGSLHSSLYHGGLLMLDYSCLFPGHVLKGSILKGSILKGSFPKGCVVGTLATGAQIHLQITLWAA
jgi:hypothetical protein